MKIIFRDINFSYPGGDKSLFSGLNLEISGPGFFSFFGFSGSGKSTLARLLSGLLRPDSGEIILVDIHSSLFSYNTERFPGWMTVEDHFEKVTPNYNKDLLDALISEFDAKDFLRHKFSRLSMGQKNRANFIRYLVQDFDLIIADEVLANVDEPTRNHILATLKKFFPEKTFIYISHNVNEVAAFSHKIFILSRTSREGIKVLSEVDGLDTLNINEVTRKELQEKVLEILKFSAETRI